MIKMVLQTLFSIMCQVGYLAAVGVVLFVGASNATALLANESEQAAGQQVKKSSVQLDAETDENGKSDWNPPAQKSFSGKEKRAECKKYEGKYIGYYGRVFKVESCRRREIVRADAIGAITAKGFKIIPVESDTIIKLEKGRELSLRHLANERSCKQLESQYVVTGASDIYFIKDCKKRLFPDWETYLEHKKKRNQNKKEILELSEFEFNRIPTDKPFQSILDEEYKRLLGAYKMMEIIPLDEACKGINGKFVTYYSKIYKIERCFKREVIGSIKQVMKLPTNGFKELNSEQWLSLPYGKPYKLKSSEKKEEK